MLKSKNVYFPNLNGIRFFAAAIVICHHIEQNKNFLGMENFWHIDAIRSMGKLGVVLFFVLSGFLITYLLLEEEKQTGTIGIKKFYFRRILKIWPLYFLIILMAFFILPYITFFNLPKLGIESVHESLLVKLTLYLFFLPNVAHYFFSIIPYASQAWSIGTEEQFYLVWPWIFRRSKKWMSRLLIITGVVLGYLFIQYFLSFSVSDFIPYKGYITLIWSVLRIDCMAIGALFAFLLHTDRFLKYILNTWLFYMVLAGTCLLMINAVSIRGINYQAYAILFGIIILNFAANDTIKISLENKILNYLGKISYGLYMYHSIAVVFCLKMITYLHLPNTNWIIYPSVFILTIAISSFSYTFFESKFLSLKNKYTVIPSNHNKTTK
jgi:peptidoglycan/LPS O-acetylase OafA/YrhL